ncbi:T9SS type A sorting domain-containing protein [Taibaiella lutea]|uniref:T9SS type A sorting domain-containing protein n=1 Tax=Taibaiella lutea TaxID=2608001 RepID=A0A5M6CNI6_9BACT|nr:T9SS type A sorting domain-containing protein [Taibaiella lutea]KAA5534709.1 T9SS type A sorting domain-containing protein [Taibaiella lutea]
MNKIILLFTLLLSSLLSRAQTFTLTDSMRQGAYGTAAWGDYDGDGRKDFVYIAQTMNVDSPDIFLVYHNTATGFVRLPQAFPMMFTPAASWADLDNDGKEDLIASGLVDSNKIHIYKSNGDGTFELINDTLPGLSAGSIAVADYNNDGLKDILATGFNNAGTASAYLFKGTGGFHFDTVPATLPGIYFSDVKWHDYDHDGRPDIAMTGIGLLSRTYIYHNEGNDSFSLASPYMNGGAGTVDWLDYDGDGWFDLLTAGNDSSGVQNFTDMYHNNGNGTFTMVTTNLPVFGEPVAADIADFNSDGKPDICLSGGNPDFIATFSAMALGSGTTNYNTTAFKQTDITNCIVAAADYDNDGDPDVLFGNYIYRNDGVPTGTKDVANPASDVSVYPNPAKEDLFIETPEKHLQLMLTDRSGRVLQQQKLLPGKNKIPLQQLAAGTYLLIFSNENKINVQSFVKQ